LLKLTGGHWFPTNISCLSQVVNRSYSLIDVFLKRGIIAIKYVNYYSD
jgi:hypothetical protein